MLHFYSLGSGFVCDTNVHEDKWRGFAKNSFAECVYRNLTLTAFSSCHSAPYVHTNSEVLNAYSTGSPAGFTAALAERKQHNTEVT